MPVRIRSAVTLSVLVVLLVVMAVVGWRSATTAFPSLSQKQQPVVCANPKVTSVIYRKQITVSVYNASRRAGYAQLTMRSMERRNFVVGAIGNAPSGTKVQRVEVRSTVKDDPRAELVAEQYKPAATVVVSDDDLGAGIDVILGPKAPRPAVPAPFSLKLAKPVTTCLDQPTSTSDN